MYLSPRLPRAGSRREKKVTVSLDGLAKQEQGRGPKTSHIQLRRHPLCAEPYGPGGWVFPKTNPTQRLETQSAEGDQRAAGGAVHHQAEDAVVCSKDQRKQKI